ncbi:glycopeptide antibiotics resistance protein [Paenibacillus sp. DS2015]|uniref:VanZ family protein n=1 Tax=Paenibacillus sp. DS2015 TaxID=3373917 RepID=UPI003D204253
MRLIKVLSKIMLAAGFIVYLYLLIKLILFKWGPVNIESLFYQLRRTLQHPDMIFKRQGNYIPFREISRGIENMSIYEPFSQMNLTGNIIAFIPFGIFIPMIFSKKGASFIAVFILSLLLSLCFEVTQLVLYIGTFDVDDLILNTFGGMVGYVFFRVFIGSDKRRRKKRKIAKT